MNDVLLLIKRLHVKDDNGDPVIQETARAVFCGVRSITQSEFYQAQTSDFHPELKFVLADYLDYDDETLVEHNGQRYRVMRTFHAGQELELVAERAPAEDGGVHG